MIINVGSDNAAYITQMNNLLKSCYRPLTEKVEWSSELLDNYKFLKSTKHIDKIFLAHNPIWPNLKNIKLPTNYDLYILAWGGEIVDVKWIEDVITYIDPKQLLLITDLEHVELDIKKFKFTHHHQLTRIFEHTKDFDIKFSSYKSRKHKSSCLHRAKDRPHRELLSSKLKRNDVLNNFNTSEMLWDTEQWEWRIEPFIDSLTNITSESFYETFNAHRPYTYLTEKTFKPIMAGCLGIHYGQPFAYQKLRNYGFLTADSLGLTYDTILNDEQRFDVFINELNLLLDNLDLKAMQEIVEYNHYWYWNKFYKGELEKNRLVEQLILEYIDNYFR